jgi:hypothetical protein
MKQDVSAEVAKETLSAAEKGRERAEHSGRCPEIGSADLRKQILRRAWAR